MESSVNEGAYEVVPLKEKNEDASVPVPARGGGVCCGWGARHTQGLLLFASLAVCYCMRAQLSVSLVAMTGVCPAPDSDLTNLTQHNHTLQPLLSNDTVRGHSCKNVESSEGWTVYRVYRWSKRTQEMILFSFFVGYTGMMLPMGALAQRCGGQLTVVVALGANALLSILTPWVPIFAGWAGVCVCRLLQGMSQAALYPSIHTMLGQWAPLRERGRLSTYVYTGSQFGTVVAFQIAGLFAGSPSLGWPWTFWMCGALSLGCLALLASLGAKSPHHHPTISTQELAYIIGDYIVASKPKKRRTPWKKILTTPAIWGIVASHAGSTVGYIFILTQIPLYMKHVLGVNIKNNGLLSSLPYVSMYGTSLLFAILADWLVNNKFLSLVNVRRVFNSIGMIVASVFLVAFCYVDSSSTATGVTLLVLCLSAHSGIHTGFHINSIDLAPNFAGPIMALGNMIANLTSLTIPLLVSSVVGDDVSNKWKWQVVFLCVAGLQSAAGAVFVVCARADVLPWNCGDNDDAEITENNPNTKKDASFL